MSKNNEVGDFTIGKDIIPFLISIRWWDEINNIPDSLILKLNWIYLRSFDNKYYFTRTGIDQLCILIHNIYKHFEFPSSKFKKHSNAHLDWYQTSEHDAS